MSVPKRFEGLIDSDGLRVRLDALVTEGVDGGNPAVRSKVLAVLKEVRLASRDKVQALLLADRRGVRCAERLSFVQDALIRAIYDFAVRHVYPVVNASSAERMAVTAVGGYGRATLAPGSDIDLLFLLPYKQTPWGESVVEYILYMLWDLGLKVGHATRNVEECVRLSRSDLTIRTAILEARFIWGDRPLFDDLALRFDRDVVQGTGRDYIAAKLAERDERHKRQGMSRYLVEPNIKEGKGGLRDLQTLFWIAKYFYRVKDTADLIGAGVFSKPEYQRFQRCDDFLWGIRCHMHFATGRAEERLSFDLQREIAARLGYVEKAGLRAVERFMKHYFLVAKDVGDLTLIFCSALEEEHVKQTPALNRFLDRFTRRRRRKAQGEGTPFILDHARINVAGPDVFSRDPVNLIRIFHEADRADVDFHPDALRLMTRSLRLIDDDVRNDAVANALFLDIVASRNDPERVLRRMNETGVLGRFVPDFGRIVAMMQFNMYHHYTVDEHHLRSIGELAAVEKGRLAEEIPLASELIHGIQNRRVLYVALFLHDVGKGRMEDHSLLGGKIARKLGPRFGLTPAETETVAWLVENHLVMSTVAQGRDLNDRRTIETFAEIVQSPERLRLLHCLTVADIRAVGPGVFNGWKGQLLRTLYYETEPYLAGGHSQVTRDQRVAAAKRELTDSLEGWSETEKKAYVERHYAPYWLRVDLPRKIEHATFIRQATRDRKLLATSVIPHVFEGVTEITVLADDHPRLLSAIAGACAVAGANIVDAQIYTTTDGLALDTIFVGREFADDHDEQRRGQRVSALIEKTLTGAERLPEQVERKIAGRARLKAFQIPTDVIVNNAWSDRFTVIEVSGLDRPGLLYDLTREISNLNLNIASAHIATFGERAVDVFYVTDLFGHKVDSRPRERTIHEHLMRAFDGVAQDPGRGDGRRLTA
ncbi:[protein-PII] uridylyltransferase [Siculibacillus lacustris]|uniref:Bifunctional uridylyltransferase/uridylyl-removing enzyme n=1 Tax=Siculibacillus lacustris TaxID=1549641 RepID=A0A4Q9VLL3_9HYPH|nr:[protein-PII] uridylyltransferase [Siculibacillus lacustris]TBW36408.1 [protein-PII] uridylyltransferase [Siculibacillus lacustris]